MKRKKLTQIFPFLIPLRRRQRTFFFYLKMWFDGNHYTTKKLEDKMPFQVYEAQSLLLNENSGFDMQYQINKVHNLKLAAKTMNLVIIKPQETFSFWQLVRNAEKYEPYKEGLCLLNSKIVAMSGGGLCQLSNLLFWLFLNTPLTIVERHHHKIEAFPLPPSDIPDGTDATVNEGWLDLKVKNETDAIFQIVISFDEQYIRGTILSDRDSGSRYQISSRNLCYFRKSGKIYQQKSIYKAKINPLNNELVEDLLLYHNQCEIGYQLSDNVPIAEKGE